MEPSRKPTNPAGFHIRRASQDDARLLAEIGRAAFDAAFGAQNNPADLQVYLSKAFSERQQAYELGLAGCTFLIAESEEEPAGYARLQTGPAPAAIPGLNPIELSRFYLLPGWIGQGFGSMLMQTCLEHAWGGGHDVIWLSTWKENARGLAFYKKWGFQIVGEQIFQVGSDPQEDWLLALSRG